MCQIRFRNRSHRHRKAMDRCGICLTKHCIRKANKGKIMSYTSSTYLLFLVAVFCIYYIIRPRHRMYVLLVANVIFYLAAGFDQFLVLLLATAVSYVVACKMGKLHEKLEKQKQEEGLDRKQIKRMKANNKKQRKRILIWGLVLNIGILVVFKYTNFLLKTGYSILDLFGIGHGDDLFKLIMPLGISFFTFQILSYLIDVYKGKVKAQKNFLKYLLYISFFPSVVQGPIPRYADLGTQLYEEHRFEYDNLRDGALLILWGFAKKLILAERLGTFVDQIYGNYTQYTGMLFFFVATAAFSIQIYADFSGCMDIATGTARLFGIRLAPNFLRPYFSKTMPEFWRRWHVTLGNWFKDYVFYPISISKFSLDLNKKARKRFGNEFGRIVSSAIPILAVWLLTGIWHGPDWKYVTWGLFHGILIMLSMIFTPYNEKLVQKLHIKTECFSFRLFQMGRTFLLCCLGRVFFRADDFASAIGILKRACTGIGWYRLANGKIYNYGLNQANMTVVIVAMLVLLTVSILQEKMDVLEALKKQNLVFRWVLIYALLLAVVIFGMYGPGYDPSAFIYEKF
ncbi:MAG: MBOAT family protein [Lachnospiraceae bacterium]|nr:MBOAT family protein [Lachnospiraceae bacterium]